MREITYAEALAEALREILESDERVRVIGSYFLGLSPRRALIAQLRKDFPRRFFDPPIAEAGYCGLAVGAAMANLRPIVDVGTASFFFQAFPQVLNEAANSFYMSGGQTSVPVVFHVLHGIRGGGGAQHSYSPQAMLWNTPGLEIVLPSTPRDVKGLFKTAVRSNNPTIFIGHPRLFEVKGEVSRDNYEIPFGQAEIKREGKDVTVVATSLMVQRAIQAAAKLEQQGIDVEIVDPRTLVPLDKNAILRSVEKTGRLIVADECHKSCGVGAEFAAIVAEEGFGFLKAPIRRVATPDVPVPFSRSMEAYIEPSAEKIVEAVLGVVK